MYLIIKPHTCACLLPDVYTARESYVWEQSSGKLTDTPVHRSSQEDPVVGSPNKHGRAEPLRAGGGDGPPHGGSLLMGERLCS